VKNEGNYRQAFKILAHILKYIQLFYYPIVIKEIFFAIFEIRKSSHNRLVIQEISHVYDIFTGLKVDCITSTLWRSYRGKNLCEEIESN